MRNRISWNKFKKETTYKIVQPFSYIEKYFIVNNFSSRREIASNSSSTPNCLRCAATIHARNLSNILDFHKYWWKLGVACLEWIYTWYWNERCSVNGHNICEAFSWMENIPRQIIGGPLTRSILWVSFSQRFDKCYKHSIKIFNWICTRSFPPGW